VRKVRRTFHIQYDGRDVEGALDVVDGVGIYVELELRADDANLEVARQTIVELAAQLNLGHSDRRSYLEMLLLK
jgi:adenylate cyclase class 2